MVKIKINLHNLTVQESDLTEVQTPPKKTSTPINQKPINRKRKRESDPEPFKNLRKLIESRKPRISAPPNYFLKKAIKNTQKFDLDDMIFISKFYEMPSLLSPIRDDEILMDSFKLSESVSASAPISPIKKKPKNKTTDNLKKELKTLEDGSFLTTPKKIKRSSKKIVNFNNKDRFERLIDSKLKKMIDNYAANVENLVKVIELEKLENQRNEVKI